MIEYINNMPSGHLVKLDGKFVGEIKRFMSGWQYWPKNSKTGGEMFKSLQDCKNSLE